MNAKREFRLRIPHPDPGLEKWLMQDAVLEYLFEQRLPMTVSNYLAHDWMFDGGSQMLLRDLDAENLAEILELVEADLLVVDRAEDQVYIWKLEGDEE